MIDDAMDDKYCCTLYEGYTDEELVLIVRNGNRVAEEYLYKKYIIYIKKIISSFYIVGAEKEDLLQEGLLGLYKAIKYYSPNKNCSFRSYAALCIRRHIISVIRYSTRQKQNPLNNYISINMMMYDDDGTCFLDSLVLYTSENPENIVLLNERKEIIRYIVKKSLSEFEKKVLTCYLSGLSYNESSKALNTDAKSVDNALQRIKRKLKQELICKVN